MRVFCELLILVLTFTNYSHSQLFNIVTNECEPDLYEIVNSLNSDPDKGSVQNCAINVSHSYLSASRGFVAEETYQVTVECLKSFDFRSYSFIVLGTTANAFGAIQGGRQFACDENLSGVVVHGNLSESDTLIKLAWTAPSDEETRCLSFLIAFFKPFGSEQNMLIKKEFCRNPGCYKIFHEAERSLSLDEIGPIGCWLFIEPLPEHNVYLQVLSFQHSNKSTDCFGLILSTDEIESTFTGPTRFCNNVTLGNSTSLYHSSPSAVIIMRYHILENEKMFLQLRFFNSPIRGCNETIVGESSGIIFSPNYPDDYYPGIDCYYTIVGLLNERIEVTIKEFSLQDPRRLESNGDLVCDADYFAIIDGSPETRQWCGSVTKITPLGYFDTIETISNILTIHFHTDMQTEMQGFKASWRTIASCQNNTLTNLSSVITSINYPDNYLNNQHCTTKIKLPKEYAIEIELQFFHLQPLNIFTTSCEEDGDYLEIENEKFCGDWTGKLHEMLLVYETNELDISFSSNIRDTGPGYKLTYSAVTPNKSRECKPHHWNFEVFCFQLVDEAKKWSSANDDCKSRNGHLAIISSESAQSFINTKLLERNLETMDKGYWIGASDLQFESDFTWIDGARVNYTRWFPGWPEFQYYNRQPNDDGLSGQNCLEIRRRYSYPSKGHGYASDFYWNDISCTSCNDTITLTATIWHATIYSPNYPSNYGDFSDCTVVINVPEKSWMILEFTKFVLEPELKCNYDYLEIWEERIINDTWTEIVPSVKSCGDWSYKLKLLRRIVSSPRIVLHFHTDHSRGFGGYHANVYFEDATNRRSINVCNNKKLRNFGNYCYLFISFPRVEWETASQICKSSGGLLASTLSYTEEMYFVDQLLRTPEYATGDFFWLGGRRTEQKQWFWQDQNDFNYTDWFDESSMNSEMDDTDGTQSCLSLQQQFQTSAHKTNSFRIADRLYWSNRNCKSAGGYICKMTKPIVSEGENRSVTLEEQVGSLYLPSYPEQYPNNFDYSVTIEAQPKTRILITFTLIDTEYQEHCLYDFVELKTHSYDKPTTFCGHIEEDLPNFASYSNQAVLTFHSDYSITATGFMAEYQVVNISNCYIDTDEQYGYINSVNFPYFYLNALDCETILRTDVNARILLDFIFFDVGDSKHNCFDTDYVSIQLDGDKGRRTTKLCGRLNTANESRNILYISYGNVVKLLFHSNDHIWGVGFKAWYQTLYHRNYTQFLVLKPNETIEMKSINYPRSYPSDLCIDIVCRVPYGYQIQINFEELYLIPEILPDNIILLNSPLNSTFAEAVSNFSYLSPWNRVTLHYCGYDDHKIAIRRFKSNVSANLDPSFWSDKALKNYTGIIDVCSPNPCFHDAPCLEGDFGPYCECSPSYLGIFCHFSFCDFNPCVHGKCEVTNNADDKYICQCDVEYTGQHCEFQIHPCESNPCQKGDCVESLGQFTCLCHEGYKGDMCEKKALFEAKTLRESFLRDPFWLGLFMILGVMASVGIVNCCRKRWSDTKMALLCNPSQQQPKNERSFPFDEEKELTGLVNSVENVCCTNDDDSEVYFNFSDLGIDPCQYNSGLQLGDVNFKMKLNDLTEEQLDTLENYLENYLKSCENNDMPNQVSQFGRGALLTVEQKDPNTGILVDLDSPNKVKARKSQLNTPDANTADKTDGALNYLAFDSITDLILKSAEIVRPNFVVHEQRHEPSPKQRHSVGGVEHMQKFLTRKSDTESRLLESKQPQTKQRFRTAAQRAITLVKRPQSVEIPSEPHEEMKRLCYRGASSFSIGRAQAFDEESAA